MGVNSTTDDQGSTVERAYASVEGARISMLTAGPTHGETVLLLHGLPASAELWRDVLLRLASFGYRAIALDLPGYGATRVPPGGDVSIRGTARLFARWIQSEGMGPVWLVGHDVGGAVAQVLAVQEPGQVAALTLGNTVAGSGWPILPVRLFQAAARLGLYPWMAAARLVPNPYIWRTLRRGFADPSALDRATAERVFWDSKVTDPEGRRAFAAHLSALDPQQTIAIAPRLAGVAAPTLLLWGAEDRFQPWHTTGLRLHGLLPDPDVILLEGIGHFAPLEGPDAYIGALLEWRRSV